MQPDAPLHPDTIACGILTLTDAAAPGRSVTPEEVARHLAPGGWRPLLGPVKEAARQLARAGRIEILRKGRPLAPAQEARGVIRLRARQTSPGRP